MLKNLSKKRLLIIGTLLILLAVTFLLKFSNFDINSNNNLQKAKYSQFLPSKFGKNNQIVAIAWNNEEGIKRFQNSKYKNDFFQLASFFQPQINPLYCGIASSVIILNAINAPQGHIDSQKEIEVNKPTSIGGGIIPFKSYSQITFLNKNTDKIKLKKIINLEDLSAKKEDIDPGLKLKELADILQQYGLNTKINYATSTNDQDIEQFRALLKEILQDSDNYIIANFYGKAFGSKTGGHISPIVAYHENSDSLLILDVAGHKNPWYWVKTKDFYKAMNLKDNKTHRGYLIISDKIKRDQERELEEPQKYIR